MLEGISEKTKTMHFAIQSLIEELQAIDDYSQRIDATTNDDLAQVLEHARMEEAEHAAMILGVMLDYDLGMNEVFKKFGIIKSEREDSDH